MTTSLNNNSRRCCFLRSIFLTATWRPVDLSVAIQTVPVDPSPILVKFSRFSRGSPAETTICNAARNCSWVNRCSVFVDPEPPWLTLPVCMDEVVLCATEIFPPLELEARELAFVLGWLLFILFTFGSAVDPAIEAGDGILWCMEG